MVRNGAAVTRRGGVGYPKRVCRESWGLGATCGLSMVSFWPQTFLWGHSSGRGLGGKFLTPQTLSVKEWIRCVQRCLLGLTLHWSLRAVLAIPLRGLTYFVFLQSTLSRRDLGCLSLAIGPANRVGTDGPSYLDLGWLSGLPAPGSVMDKSSACSHWSLLSIERLLYAKHPAVLCLVCQLCLTLCEPSRLLCPWGFSRQEYRSGLLCLPPQDLPTPGIEATSPAL